MLDAAPLSAVVTGANRGLGLALSDRLGQLGFDVLLTTRRGGDDGYRAAAQLRLLRAIANAYEPPLVADCRSRAALIEVYDPPFDVSDRRSRLALAEHCRRRGGVDILVNNAAVCIDGWSEMAVRTTLRTNFLAPLALTHALLPEMARRGRGYVINISSGDGELVYLHSALQAAIGSATSTHQLVRAMARASPPTNAFGPSPAHGPTPAYSMSKAALNAATRLVEKRLGDHGVWVGSVCPGDVLTRMCSDHERALSPEHAATEVLWVLEKQIHEQLTLPSGRFWRARSEIPL